MSPAQDRKHDHLSFNDDERLPDYANWEEDNGVWTLIPADDGL